MLIGHQDAHDLQADAVFKGLIELFEGILHRSYLKCMTVP
jgi:hypothetical protein